MIKIITLLIESNSRIDSLKYGYYKRTYIYKYQLTLTNIFNNFDMPLYEE